MLHVVFLIRNRVISNYPIVQVFCCFLYHFIRNSFHFYSLPIFLDVLALKLMNDTIVEEVNPYRLTKYLSNQTKNDLGFSEFEDTQNRKLRTQYILNRISSDSIGEFMIAIRQGGYEHIYRQIKEGME